MTGFWERALGGTVADRPPVNTASSPQPAQSSRPWWQSPTVTTPTVVPVAPPPVAEAVYQPQQASSLRNNAGGCPECGSGNYSEMRAHGTVTYRCFDCGYPTLQSGSGVRSIKSDGSEPVQAARQVAAGGNFQPNPYGPGGLGSMG